MEELLELKQKLELQRPAEWEQFPDIGLYMDQVISYMSRQMIRFEEQDKLTPAMVNNYIKYGLLPRADGKKYSRMHLAYLTVICSLKQVLSVRDIDMLLKQEITAGSPEEYYEKYCTVLDEALMATSGAVNPEWELSELADAAARLAISSYAEKMACERLVAIIRNKTAAPVRKKEHEAES